MKTALIIVGALIGVFVLYLVVSITLYKKKLEKYSEEKASKNIIKLNGKNFKTVVGQGITLVDFWAAWCKPCVFLAPIISQLADEYHGRVKVAKLDVDANKKIAQDLGIMNIPTVIVYKNGKEIQRIIGVKTAKTYRKILDDLLNN